jgi:alpha-tubulin suppressor-like RCC1 family protein
MTDKEDFCMIAGGEHHSIGLTVTGKVYCWGRNDESQCGKGDVYTEFRKNRGQ